MRLVALFALAVVGFAQTAFETASIAPSDPDSEQRCSPNNSVGQSFAVKNCSIGALILFAYDVLQQQVSGETSHLDDKYDVSARASQPVTRAQMKRMLQTLLEDRFQLTMRRETKDTPVYALVVGKDGPKFHDSPTASEGAPKPVAGSAGQLTIQNCAMADLVFALSRRLPDRLVVDKTGLAGKYDLDMSWYLALGKPNPPPVFTAVQTLGLQLEPQTTPVLFLIIDRVEKPSKN